MNRGTDVGRPDREGCAHGIGTQTEAWLGLQRLSGEGRALIVHHEVLVKSAACRQVRGEVLEVQPSALATVAQLSLRENLGRRPDVPAESLLLAFTVSLCRGLGTCV